MQKDYGNRKLIQEDEKTKTSSTFSSIPTSCSGL